jgi:hypothetical protein
VLTVLTVLFALFALSELTALFALFALFALAWRFEPTIMVVLLVFAHSGVQHLLCCFCFLLFVFGLCLVLCTLCCKFLWIVVHCAQCCLRLSGLFIVPKVACVSLDCSFVISPLVLHHNTHDRSLSWLGGEINLVLLAQSFWLRLFITTGCGMIRGDTTHTTTG